MKHLYRHYLQVKISSRRGQKPQIQGYEEIWQNGQRQVRHWTDSDELGWLPRSTSELWDLWFTPETESAWSVVEPGIWSELDSGNRFPRYINPMEVEVKEPVLRKWVLGEQWSKVKQFFALGWQKVQRISQRLPAACQAAWRELNGVD